MTFKPGDRVRCVKDDYLPFTAGNVYSVWAVQDDGRLTIAGHLGAFEPGRFVLIETAPQFRTRTVSIREVSTDGGETWTAAPEDWQK